MAITVKLEGVDDVKAAFSAKLEEYRAGIEAAVSSRVPKRPVTIGVPTLPVTLAPMPTRSRFATVA